MAIVINRDERELLLQGLYATAKQLARRISGESNQAIKELLDDQLKANIQLQQRVQIFEVSK